jgi:DNA-binding PadR family transcriptional regulator
MVISKQQDSDQGPSRRVFTITEEGKRQLVEETLDLLSRRIPLPSSFYVGIALLKHVNSADAIRSLSVHIDSVSNRLKQLSERSQPEQPEIVNTMFDLGRRLAQAEKSWLEEFSSHLQKLDDWEDFYGDR